MCSLAEKIFKFEQFTYSESRSTRAKMSKFQICLSKLWVFKKKADVVWVSALKHESNHAKWAECRMNKPKLYTVDDIKDDDFTSEIDGFGIKGSNEDFQDNEKYETFETDQAESRKTKAKNKFNFNPNFFFLIKLKKST